MKKILFCLILTAAPASMAHATPISISSFGTAYIQNFDGLANNPSFSTTVKDPTTFQTAATGSQVSVSNGTNAATLQGFEFAESGTSGRVDGAYTVDNGTSAIGDSFNYGSSAGSSDRAFGVLTSGTFGNGIGANAATPGTAFGFVFTNDTNATIDSLTISYKGEQYRYGGATGNPDRIDVQIDRSGDSIFGTNFNNVDSLDFASPVRTGATGALDGNAAGNFTLINGVFAPTGGIAAGNSFVLRFVPIDQAGADDGLAIDDLSVTANVATPEPSTYAMLGMGMVGVVIVLRRRKKIEREPKGVKSTLELAC